jgi:hypothetical protein
MVEIADEVGSWPYVDKAQTGLLIALEMMDYINDREDVWIGKPIDSR